MTMFPTPGHCPTCGYKFDASTIVEGSARSIQPGDISLCMQCGEVLEYNATMQMVVSDYRDSEVLKVQKLLRSEEWQITRKVLRAPRNRG